MRIPYLCIVISFVLFASCHRGDVIDDALARKLDKVADTLYLGGQRQEAVRFMDSVHAKWPEKLLLTYFTYARRVQYQTEVSNFDNALQLNDSCILLMEEGKAQQKYAREYIHSLLERGNILSIAKKYDSAYKAYTDGYAFVLKAGDNCARHEFDYHIGMALYGMNNRVKARELFKQSFAEACNCEGSDKPWYRMQELLGNIALCYKGAPEQMLYYDSCISFINHNKDKFLTSEMVADALSTAYRNKGTGLVALNRIPEAREAWMKGIDVYMQLDSNKYRNRTLDEQLALAITLYYVDDTEGVKRMWRQLKPIADTVTEGDIKQGWLRLNFMYHEIVEDYKTAYYGMGDLLNFMDSVRYMNNDSSRKDLVQDLQNKEQAYNIQLLTKEKQLQRTYLWVAILLSGVAIVVVIMVYRNYKKTQRANETISRQKEALEQSNREKDGILNVVAHDLRNPIGSISFIADMMLMEDGSAMETGEAFGMIKSASTGSLQLVDELLEVARNDKSTLKKAPTDISALVRESIAALKYKADEKEQQVEYKADEQAGTLTIDKEKMARVISNLVTNAIKFSPKGGKTEVTAEQRSGVVVIKVADNGIGIPADKIPGLFQMFTNARRKGTANEESFGLGLAICKQIVEAHGGTLSVESTEGQGSTFIIELPA